MKIFHLFSGEAIEDTLKKEYGLTVIATYRLCLSKKQYERFCCGNIYNNNIKYVTLVETDEGERICTKYDHELFDDCNSLIQSMLNKKENIWGISSEKINKRIQALLFGGDRIEIKKENCIRNLVGDNGFRSLNEFFQLLYSSEINYVVLRKYDKLPDFGSESDKDIDLLTDDPLGLVRLTNSCKRSCGPSAYCVNINNDLIPLDIRFVGDAYYDSSWEQNMLANKIYNERGIAIMDNENYFFSLLYHVLTQKKYIPQNYISILKTLSNDIFGKEYSREDYLELLTSYMNLKNYSYLIPMDSSVYRERNASNINYLKRHISCFNITKAVRIYRKIPVFFKDMIPIDYFYKLSHVLKGEQHNFNQKYL